MKFIFVAIVAYAIGYFKGRGDGVTDYQAEYGA